ncbi:MAG: Ryanodine receptor Ryr [Alistipes sp.]|nr:Ryanodine receptor Ryr [Alistipes sp.]
MKTYIPCPIDLSDVELADELNELREAIAENAHDVWAAERQAQGWTYGAKRDDLKKETPCMVAYSQLPESEKTFDREMAMNTLKLLTKLGYDIVKRKK